MNFFYPLTNIIQNYPWGSKTSIPHLFDIANIDNKPMAEIWMGAHPKASSVITWKGKATPLHEAINNNAEALIGTNTSQRFGELPFLFKVLAAEKALSIQVHPTKMEAEIGYQKENDLGIAIDAYNRNYKDPNHKPELVYALTPYLAMNGFREFDEIATLLKEVKVDAIEELIQQYTQLPDSKSLQILFQELMTLDEVTKLTAINQLLSWAHRSNHSLAEFILDLNEVYPDDIGLLSPLLLNVVLLQPGEAMFLHAGTPHAYVKGTALEIMANSDNVLRGGLTPKYIDVPELISACTFMPLEKEKILTQPKLIGAEQQFPVPVEDFSFSIFSDADSAEITPNRGEIWFVIDGSATFKHHTGEELTITKGESAFIPFISKTFVVTNIGNVARAY
ncbi:Mannose-6-phosphate isomerase [Vibrio cyclitrophicus]|nr:Mannose-6-phosphate isomerase [Vibrio cyclitrophicus]